MSGSRDFPRPVLILQLRPEDVTADDEYRAILEHGGISRQDTERHRIEQSGIPELDLDDYTAVIVGGSPFDVSKPENQKSPEQLRVERDFDRFFDQITARDMPFLGACSGNGLLGGWCGATISGRYSEPVSAVDITLTDDGLADPLLKEFPRSFRALVGHKEACDDTPPGAVLLASSAACPVQMFRVGRNVYATQFHPEGDPAGFILRIAAYRHHGYFAPEDADRLIAELEHEMTPWPHELLRRFIANARAATS